MSPKHSLRPLDELASFISSERYRDHELSSQQASENSCHSYLNELLNLT